MRALVTGANRGLGLEFVRQLLARGARVVAACRHPGRAQALTALAAAHPGHLQVLPLDLARDAGIAELAREVSALHDGLELLVNNAGVLVPGERFGALDSEALESSLRSNVVGPLLLTQALAPLLAAGTAPARVANVSSVMGSIAATSEFRSPSYGISKAALNMATRQLAFALAPYRAIVLALHPGWVRTDMGGDQAPLDAMTAVAGLMRVIESARPQDSGCFLDYSGRVLDW